MSESDSPENSTSDHGTFEPKFTTGSGEPLMKEVVTGWMVTQLESNGGGEQNVFQKPIVAGATDSSGDYAHGRSFPILEGETVLDVIPAEPGTRMVYGVIGSDWEELGIEYPDASNPDWDEVLDSKTRFKKNVSNTD